MNDKNEMIDEVLVAWDEFQRELNKSLVGMMDLPEKRAMGRMCMAVSALRELGIRNVELGMAGVEAEVTTEQKPASYAWFELKCAACGLELSDSIAGVLNGQYACVNGYKHKWVYPDGVEVSKAREGGE